MEKRESNLGPMGVKLIKKSSVLEHLISVEMRFFNKFFKDTRIYLSEKNLPPIRIKNK